MNIDFSVSDAPVLAWRLANSVFFTAESGFRAITEAPLRPARFLSLGPSPAPPSGGGPSEVSALARRVVARHQPLDVLGDDVDLEIDVGADRRRAQGGHLQRGGDQGHLEPVVTEPRDGQRDAVD